MIYTHSCDCMRTSCSTTWTSRGEYKSTLWRKPEQMQPILIVFAFPNPRRYRGCALRERSTLMEEDYSLMRQHMWIAKRWRNTGEIRSFCVLCVCLLCVRITSAGFSWNIKIQLMLQFGETKGRELILQTAQYTPFIKGTIFTSHSGLCCHYEAS